MTAHNNCSAATEHACAKFVMWCMSEGSFQGADIDGGAAQDKAVELGLLTETTYDPNRHGPSDCCEQGDTWYVPTDELVALLSSAPAQPSVEAMKAAVELEIHAALGRVQTVEIGRMIQKAIDASHNGSSAGRESAADTEMYRLRDLIASHIACEDDCKKMPTGCGCALTAARAVMNAVPQAVADIDEATFFAMVNAARDEHKRLKDFYPITADVMAMLKAALAVSRPQEK